MKKLILTTILVLILSVAVYATEHLISLQGQASDSSKNPLSTGDISVRIYDDASDGNLVYNSGTDFNNVINNGIYDILLSVDLDNTKKYYIEIDINEEEVVGDATSGRQEFWPASGDHTHSHDVSWSGLSDVPGGFADGIDNVGSSLWSQSGSDIYYNAGDVGIGKTSPTAKLDVNGNVKIEGDLTLTGKLILPENAQIVIGSYEIGLSASGNELLISTPTSGSMTLVVDGDYTVMVNENLVLSSMDKLEVHAGTDLKLDSGNNINVFSSHNTTVLSLDRTKIESTHTYIKSGLDTLIESGITSAMKSSGNFVYTDFVGVWIQGTLVNINSPGTPPPPSGW